MSEPRKLKPRDPVVTAAAFVSQLNSLPLVGIDPRRFLTLLPLLDVRVVEVGKLRLVAIDDLREALRAMATAESSPPDPVEDDEDDSSQLASADEVLAALGVRSSA